jgi:hypothetical protein
VTNPSDNSSQPGAGPSPQPKVGQRTEDELPGKVKQDAQQAKDKVAEEARRAKEDVQARARAEAESASARGAEEVDRFAQAVEATASSLREEDMDGLATYASDLSERMAKFAGNLRERSPEQLAADARSLARDNPTAFLVGSVALGFGLSRFFKASAPQPDHASMAPDYRGPDSAGAGTTGTAAAAPAAGTVARPGSTPRPEDGGARPKSTQTPSGSSAHRSRP